MTTVMEPEDQVLDDNPADDYVDPEAADPEAPYGRRPDGKPYTISPEERARRGQALADARAAKAGTGGRRRNGPKVAAPGKRTSATKQPEGPDFLASLNGLLVQLPSFALGMLGRANPTFQLDSAAVLLHGPMLAQAVNETAKVDARLAALLERITAVGPYGMIIAAAAPLVLQILANHGVMPANRDAGVLPPEELISRVIPEGAYAAA